MTQQTLLSNEDVFQAITPLVEQIDQWNLASPRLMVRVYAVPRGGIPVAYAIAAHCKAPIVFTESPVDADFIVDDIIDSGRTRDRYAKFPGKFIAPFVRGQNIDTEWLVFPWENGEGAEEGSITDNVVRLLQYVGEDATRGGLLETPERVAKAWRQWCSGYDKKPEDILKVFEDGADKVDEMVTVRNIPFYSHCEHHMAPFFGTATVAYIPDGKIVGLSKLSRLVDMYARRLQVQERLTNQIADAITEHLNPKGVGVLIRARHMCMESRGICQQGHETVTSALRGALKEQPAARAEFLAIADGKH